MNLLKVKLFQNNLWCTRPGRILTLPSLPYNGCSTNPPPPRSCTLRRPPLQPKQSLKVPPTTRDLWDQRPTDGQTVIVKVSQPLPKFPHCLIHKDEGRRCKSKGKTQSSNWFVKWSSWLLIITANQTRFYSSSNLLPLCVVQMVKSGRQVKKYSQYLVGQAKHIYIDIYSRPNVFYFVKLHWSLTTIVFLLTKHHIELCYLQ